MLSLSMERWCSTSLFNGLWVVPVKAGNSSGARGPSLAAHPAACVQAQCWECCVQVVTGESGSDEDRQRDQLLRRATELRGSISRAQDRYGAVMDALRATEDMATLPTMTQQVRLL